MHYFRKELKASLALQMTVLRQIQTFTDPCHVFGNLL